MIHMKHVPVYGYITLSYKNWNNLKVFNNQFTCIRSINPKKMSILLEDLISKMIVFHLYAINLITIISNSSLFQTSIQLEKEQGLWMFKTLLLYLLGIMMIMFIQLKNLVLMVNSKKSKLTIKNSLKEFISPLIIRMGLFLSLDVKLTWYITF